MPPAATRPHVPSTLYLAFELGNTEWKLAMTTRVDQAPLLRTIPARELKTLEVELARLESPFRSGRHSAGPELLRTGTRRVPAASLFGQPGNRQQHRRFLEHRGESPPCGRYLLRRLNAATPSGQLVSSFARKKDTPDISFNRRLPPAGGLI